GSQTVLPHAHELGGGGRLLVGRDRLLHRVLDGGELRRAAPDGRPDRGRQADGERPGQPGQRPNTFHRPPSLAGFADVPVGVGWVCCIGGCCCGGNPGCEYTTGYWYAPGGTACCGGAPGAAAAGAPGSVVGY